MCGICKQNCSLPCRDFENAERNSPYQKRPEFSSEPYKRQRCDKPCQEQLPCGHSCIGICGEVCPNLCRVCNEDAVEFSDSERGARFVELVDCRHVFEVKTLDQWIDESAVEEGEKEIKRRQCPKCSTPILHTHRYQEILSDFNAVKRRILLSKVVNHEQVERVREELKTFKADEMKVHVRNIERSINSSGLTSQQVSKCQNQVTFLKFLDHLITKYNLISEMNQKLFCSINFLTKRIMGRRLCFSEQEVKEFMDELSRTKLLVCLHCLKIALEGMALTLSPEEDRSVNSIQRTLASGKVVGKCTLKFPKIQAWSHGVCFGVFNSVLSFLVYLDTIIHLLWLQLNYLLYSHF